MGYDNRDRREKLDGSNPFTRRDRRAATLAELQNAMLSDGDDELMEETGLAISNDGVLAIGGYQLTPLGLVAGDGVTRNDWERVGNLLFRLEGAIQLLIGDWLVQAEMKWGETYEQIAEETGRAVNTLYNYKWVAENVQISLRKETLSFNHYLLVAGLDDNGKRLWLDRAVEFGWSVHRLRDEIKTLSAPTPTKNDIRKKFNFTGKTREISKIEKRIAKAGEGDTKAKTEARGIIAEFRVWLDDLEDYLNTH